MSQIFSRKSEKPVILKNRGILCLTPFFQSNSMQKLKSQNQYWAKRAVRAKLDNYC